jgi:uncharacterized HAD superfamily protein
MDIDGVLADFMYGFTNLAATKFDTLVTRNHEYERWDETPGLTREQIQWTWAQIAQSYTFWIALNPLVLKSTFFKLSRLSERADIYYATARTGKHVKWQTETWLRGWDVLNPTVLVTGRKGEVAAALGATHLIDDKAGNALCAYYLCPGLKSYILDRPYNRFDHTIVGSGVKRVATVEDFLTDVEAACGLSV